LTRCPSPSFSRTRAPFVSWKTRRWREGELRPHQIHWPVLLLIPQPHPPDVFAVFILAFLTVLKELEAVVRWATDSESQMIRFLSSILQLRSCSTEAIISPPLYTSITDGRAGEGGYTSNKSDNSYIHHQYTCPSCRPPRSP
jgi:hypothetical protein